jgi:hypothetical protein
MTERQFLAEHRDGGVDVIADVLGAHTTSRRVTKEIDPIEAAYIAGRFVRVLPIKLNRKRSQCDGWEMTTTTRLRARA